MKPQINIPQFKAIAYLRDPIRSAEVGLNERNIVKQWLEHGSDLFILPSKSELVMQPAAAGISKPTMSQGELPKLKKQPKTTEVLNETVSLTTDGVSKPKRQPRGSLYRPVVNITKGIYFSSLGAAAQSVQTPDRHLCTHLNKSAKVKTKSIRGNVFRYATAMEIERGKAMVTEQEKAALPALHANTGRKPGQHNLPQPIICINNGSYFPSVYSAAKVMGLSNSNLSDHLRPNSTRNRKSVNGFTFRYATPEEISSH